MRNFGRSPRPVQKILHWSNTFQYVTYWISSVDSWQRSTIELQPIPIGVVQCHYLAECNRMEAMDQRHTKCEVEWGTTTVLEKSFRRPPRQAPQYSSVDNGCCLGSVGAVEPPVADKKCKGTREGPRISRGNLLWLATCRTLGKIWAPRDEPPQRIPTAWVCGGAPHAIRHSNSQLDSCPQTSIWDEYLSRMWEGGVGSWLDPNVFLSGDAMSTWRMAGSMDKFHQVQYPR